MGYGMVEQHLAKFVELGMMGHVESSHGLRADDGGDHSAYLFSHILTQEVTHANATSRPRHGIPMTS